jgi:hypothetical protein
MRRLLIKLIVAAVAFFGFLGYVKYDEAANFEEVMAKVTKVEERCYLKKKERGVLTKTSTTTKEGPCHVIAALNGSHPEYENFKLVKNTYVEYRYRSPADGKVHRGMHRQAKHGDGRPVRQGDQLSVLAHTSDPAVTRQF